MNLGLFEDAGYRQLLPLTWLRPAFELRCGIDRLIDKAQTQLKQPVARLWLREELAPVVHERTRLADPAPDQDWCLLNSRAMLTGNVNPPPVGTAWQRNGVLLAVGLRAEQVAGLSHELFLDDEALHSWVKQSGLAVQDAPDAVRLIQYPWDLPLANYTELCRQCGPGGVQEGRVYPGAHLLNPDEIRVEKGAVIKPGAVLDAEEGPIHVAAGAQIQPNAVLEGPCYIGPRALVRAGAVIRGGTTIGPVCKVGGEIDASIIHGYSNKQHEGFLGHSYVAEWVNLGAGTVTSDLKNTYGTIRVYLNGVGVETGQHFLGAIIADHAKTGIGTVLPTGAIVGVCANVFTHKTVPRFVSSFAWLTDAGLTHYRIEKAVQIAQIVMARREVDLSEAEIELLRQIAELAQTVEAAGWG